jgi:Tol biopolymer transport system component
VVHPDGSGLRRLTSNTVGEGNPSWSPDCSLIAFHSDAKGVADIYAMRADGSPVTRLTTAGGQNAAWSRNGRQIAFTSSRDGNPEIYLMNADGSAQTRLTTPEMLIEVEAITAVEHS